MSKKTREAGGETLLWDIRVGALCANQELPHTWVVQTNRKLIEINLVSEGILVSLRMCYRDVSTSAKPVQGSVGNLLASNIQLYIRGSTE